MTGSVQQSNYLTARARGRSMHGACVEADFPLQEARLIENAIARGEIVLPCGQSPHTGEAERASPTPEIPAAGQAASQQEPIMARRPSSRRQAASVEQEQKPDFDRAVRIYREDIKPAQGRVGEFSQEMSTAYKAIKKECHIQRGAAKKAFELDNMEESKRDDWLRSFRGMLIGLNIHMPSDLVDAAEGNKDAGGEVIPTAERRRPHLATVPDHPADSSDLNGGEHEESGVDRAQAAAAEAAE